MGLAQLRLLMNLLHIHIYSHYIEYEEEEQLDEGQKYTHTNRIR